MTVLPFVRPQLHSHKGVRIALRRDLRTGTVAAGAARAETADADPVETLLSARELWRDRNQRAPLSIAPGAHIVGDATSAGDFAAMLLSAGFSPRGVDIEVEEAALATLAGVERLRARGFGVALRADPACPLPFGARTRSLFTELLMPAPARLDPYLGLDADDSRPLARRMFAAKAQGILVTALDVGDDIWARALANAGFDRGEGAFAD
jgi:hypothetical protein